MTENTDPSIETADPRPAGEPIDAPVVDEADLYEPIPADDAEPGSGPGEAEPALASVRKVRSPGRVATVAVLVLVLVLLAAYGAMRANAIWGRRAMVVTGVTGIEALIQGRGDELAAVSAGAVKAQLTPAVKNTMRGKGILADFGTPAWSGNSVVVTATTGMGPGFFVAGASKDGADVVIYKTAGTLSNTTGALSLERTWSGWRITGVNVELTPSTSATVSPSAPPTATP